MEKKKFLSEKKLAGKFEKILGITLIPIGYWWDQKIESLKCTIYQCRPELFNEKPTGFPIPTTIVKSETMKRKGFIVTPNMLVTNSFIFR